MIDLGSFGEDLTDIDVTTTVRAQDNRGRWIEKPVVTRLHGYYLEDAPAGQLAVLSSAGVITAGTFVAQLIGPINDLLQPGVMIIDVSDGTQYRIQDTEKWGS